MSEPITVLITDLDNTLFDWLATWEASFTAMLRELIRISGCSEAAILDQIRAVHQAHGTSEYAFLIEEIPSLRKPGESREDLLMRFAPAINAFRDARRNTLELYPGVKDTLTRLRGQGVFLGGYTESLAYYSNYRMRKLGLDTLLDVLYSPPDHRLPVGLTPDDVRRYPGAHYEFQHTRHEHTPPGEHKPNPRLLLHIIKSAGGTPAATAYVGDSLLKDVAMAQDAGVLDIFASYGCPQDRSAYDLLRRVTHWTDDDVERERHLLERPPVRATHVLHQSFAELLDVAVFASHRATRV